MKPMESEFHSRRRFMRAAAAAAALVPGGIGWLASEVLAQGKAVDEGIRRFRGEVLVNGQPVKRGSIVKPGDTVTTGPNSYATFVVGQDAFLVRGNTKLELGGLAGIVNLARVITGKLLSVYAKGTPREIQGVTATIGIRGTGAYIESSADRTYFCLCYGEAEIVPIVKPEAKETVRTTHHEQPRFIFGKGADKVMERAPVIDHKDAELILLESLVGRVPPFVEMDEYRSGVRY
jgi:hypothetical protein